MPRQSLTPTELARGRYLGTALRDARAERSPSEVSAAASISSETLRKIEAGRVATPAFSTIAALSVVLGISLDELWTAMAQIVVVADEDTAAPSEV